MNRRTIIVLAIATFGVSTGLLFEIHEPSSDPVLVVEGVERSETNSTQLVKLRLDNRSRKSIWLLFSGEGFPLRPPFLELSAAVMANNTNVYSIIRAGSFFMHGEEVLPGKSLSLDFPVVSGEPAKQVGVSYYVGDFKDGNDFTSSLGILVLANQASLKDKIEFFFDKFKRSLKRPKYGEAWCAQALSFRSGVSTNNNREAPLNREIRQNKLLN